MPSATFARKATVRNARLRAAFSGPSKSGKSFDSLVIATSLLDTLKQENALKGNGEILVIDSESGRCEEQYGDVFSFYTFDLADFSPAAYMDAIDKAVAEQFSCIIIDQISHEWAGKNGILEKNANIQATSGGKINSFTAWAQSTPEHTRFMEAISRCPTHMICTMRVKQEYVLEANEFGKMVPRKLGLAPVQRDSTEYEFDIYGSISQDHILKIETRGSLSRLIGDREFRPGRDIDNPGEVATIGKLIGQWIAGRVDANNNFATRDQINEIQELGDNLKLQHNHWKKVYEVFGISSLNMMTPEVFEKIKKDMKSKIAKKDSEKKAVSQV